MTINEHTIVDSLITRLKADSSLVEIRDLLTEAVLQGMWLERRKEISNAMYINTDYGLDSQFLTKSKLTSY